MAILAGNQRGYYWCHECKDWQPTLKSSTYRSERFCTNCGETVLCDECGQAWTDDHVCRKEVEE